MEAVLDGVVRLEGLRPLRVHGDGVDEGQSGLRVRRVAEQPVDQAVGVLRHPGVDLLHHLRIQREPLRAVGFVQALDVSFLQFQPLRHEGGVGGLDLLGHNVAQRGRILRAQRAQDRSEGLPFRALGDHAQRHGQTRRGEHHVAVSGIQLLQQFKAQLLARRGGFRQRSTAQ